MAQEDYLKSAIVVSKWSMHGETHDSSTTPEFESTESKIKSLFFFSSVNCSTFEQKWKSLLAVEIVDSN